MFFNCGLDTVRLGFSTIALHQIQKLCENVKSSPECSLQGKLYRPNHASGWISLPVVSRVERPTELVRNLFKMKSYGFPPTR